MNRTPLRPFVDTTGNGHDEKRQLTNALLEVVARVNLIDEDVVATKVEVLRMSGRLQRVLDGKVAASSPYREAHDSMRPGRRRLESLSELADDDITAVRELKLAARDAGRDAARDVARLKTTALVLSVVLAAAAVAGGVWEAVRFMAAH